MSACIAIGPPGLTRLGVLGSEHVLHRDSQAQQSGVPGYITLSPGFPG